MNFTIISENPTRVQTKHPCACSDCGYEAIILTSTIAGWMCSDCAKAFQAAACGLAKFARREVA